MKEKSIVITIIILVLLWIGIPSLAQPIDYGSTHTLLGAGEVEVGWFRTETPSGYQYTMEYNTEDVPIDIYIVSQNNYNSSSKTIPSGYIHHEHGQSGIITIQGPLPRLYTIYYSEVEQWITIDSFVDSPYSFSVRTYSLQNLLLPVTASLIIALLYVEYKNRFLDKNGAVQADETITDKD